MERIEQKLNKVFAIIACKEKEIKELKKVCEALYKELIKIKKPIKN